MEISSKGPEQNWPTGKQAQTSRPLKDERLPGPMFPFSAMQFQMPFTTGKA
jgi:hypothetical protein